MTDKNMVVKLITEDGRVLASCAMPRLDQTPDFDGIVSILRKDLNSASAHVFGLIDENTITESQCLDATKKIYEIANFEAKCIAFLEEIMIDQIHQELRPLAQEVTAGIIKEVVSKNHFTDFLKDVQRKQASYIYEAVISKKGTK